MSDNLALQCAASSCCAVCGMPLGTSAQGAELRIGMKVLRGAGTELVRREAAYLVCNPCVDAAWVRLERWLFGDDGVKPCWVDRKRGDGAIGEDEASTHRRSDCDGQRT